MKTQRAVQCTPYYITTMSACYDKKHKVLRSASALVVIDLTPSVTLDVRKKCLHFLKHVWRHLFAGTERDTTSLVCWLLH